MENVRWVIWWSYKSFFPYVFSSEHAFPSKFWIYLELCPRGEAVITGHLRLSSMTEYEVASHVKKTAIPAIIIIIRVYDKFSLETIHFASDIHQTLLVCIGTSA